MKICFVSGALPNVPCGIGDYVDALARSLARRNQEIVVLTTASPDLQTPSAYRAVALHTEWSFGDLGHIAAAVRRERPDILHLQFPGVGFGRGFGASFAPWAVRLRGQRPLLATTLHEFPQYRFRHRARVALAVSACDLVIAPDPLVLAAVRRHLTWRRGLLTTMIPVAANFWPDKTDVVDAETAPGTEFTIGYWGFLRPDKGVEFLLEAFARVRQTQDARLVLAGDPGPDTRYVSWLRNRADDLGISAWMRTTGKLSTDQLSKELQSFDVCVLPFRDGLSLNRTTYAGAVAHGLYIVTTALQKGGFDEATNTTFVPPLDRDALTSAILQAPSHPRRPSAAMAQDAWDKIADLHLAAYRRAGVRAV